MISKKRIKNLKRLSKKLHIQKQYWQKNKKRNEERKDLQK